jgi:CxxC motif-containing protein (DUF1111 family)
MYESPLKRVRRRVGVGMFSVVVVGTIWSVTPGLPVTREPSAPVELKKMGMDLFGHEWEPNDSLAKGDGLGPVFNARSCVACHSQGGMGGGGDNSHNVTAFEAFPTKDRPEVKGGLIHRFATETQFREGGKELQELFPIIPKVTLQISSGCQIEVRDFNPVHTKSVNSTALFGAGWIDQISEKTIRHQSAKTSAAVVYKEFCGDFSMVNPGRPRILPDGRLGKFGWKAQFATLEEFVAAACANEIGLGNPRMPQARSMACRSDESVEDDLSPGQFSALVSFVNTLPRPIEVLPDNLEQKERAGRGRQLFGQIGCAVCHIPDMGGVQGVYSDFLLHRVQDQDTNSGGYDDVSPVPFPEDHPLPDEWKTPALWGVADSAPYLHDGSCPTLEEAVLKHDGDAKNVLFNYKHLSSEERAAVIAFLKTLRAPKEAPLAPLPIVPKGKLAMR